MTVIKGSLLGLLVIALILAASLATGEAFDVYPYERSSEYQPAQTPADTPEAGKGYLGRLIIYMVEPDSRWETYTPDQYYHNGFIGFAYDSTFDLTAVGGTLDRTISWHPISAYNNITPDNLMAIAVLYDQSQYVVTCCDTNVSVCNYYFNAYYSDACAAATVDEEWYNTVNDAFTHTVFIEEGTATWCPSCPSMATQLAYAHQFYTDYPFFYAAMVVDMDDAADIRMNDDLNLHWLPTTYFDGGQFVQVGSTAWFNIGTMVENAGHRTVPGFGMKVALTQISGVNYQVHVTLTENQRPNNPAAPGGDDQAVVGGTCKYIGSATDPDSDDMYYRFAWGTTDTSDWSGPFASGAVCDSFPHVWTAGGTFSVKVQAKDEWGFESSWSPGLNVTVYTYMAGDANGNGAVNILDCTYLISYLYKSGPPPNPLAAGDANGNGSINILDVTYLINYLYKGGPAPVYPS
ncbi:MAG: dockerin type I repeat-containing protein [Candidatus Zixiibacteriota bacterium]